MRLKLVKASQGLLWVRQGLQACRKQPLGFVGLMGLSSTIALLLMSLFDDLGAALTIGLAPVVWMGFMLATRRVLMGQNITPTVMVETLKGPDAPQREFVILGVLYALAFLGAMKIGTWLGPDPALLDDIRAKAKDIGDLMNDPIVQQSMLWEMVPTLPVTLLFLSTPALIAWARVPVAKALFFSAVAIWRNLGAFVMFGLGWLCVLMAAAMVAGLFVVMVPVPMVASVLAIAVSMWVAAAFYASLYFTVADCFEAPVKEAA